MEFLFFIVPKLYLMCDVDVLFPLKNIAATNTIWSCHRFPFYSNYICAKIDHMIFNGNECIDKMPHRTISETSALGICERNPQNVYFCKRRRHATYAQAQRVQLYQRIKGSQWASRWSQRDTADLTKMFLV